MVKRKDKKGFFEKRNQDGIKRLITVLNKINNLKYESHIARDDVDDYDVFGELMGYGALIND